MLFVGSTKLFVSSKSATELSRKISNLLSDNKLH